MPVSSGYNVIPFSSMAGGWLGPLLMFWLYVLGPLRPFRYPVGDFFPQPLTFTALLTVCVSLWWVPRGYLRVQPFERSGRIYELLGVRVFRWLVPDGDLANRWRRRNDPGHRILRGRRSAAAFVHRTEQSERGHLVLFAAGLMSAAFAWHIGWRGWAVYLSVGNVLVNVYPILLQRYTRTRIASILGPDRFA